MKKINPTPVFCPVIIFIISASLSSLFPIRSHAQSYKKRTYANFQGIYRSGTYAAGVETIFGSVSNASLSADNNPQTASTMSIPLGLAGTATVIQFLEFTTSGSHSTVRTISAGTPVSVKFSVPASLLSLLDDIEIGTYTGLHTVSQTISGPLAFLGTGTGNSAGYDASVKTMAYSGAGLLSALNGAGQLELTFSPSQSYNGVYVKLNASALSLSLTTDIFHAYILEDAPTNCTTLNNVIDVLYGVTGNSLVDAASATGSVNSPMNAVDNDPSLTTYSTLSTGVQVLSNVFESVVFESPSFPGDSLRIVLQDPGAGLLDLSVLTGFVLQPYINNTPAGAPVTSASSFINLRLLSGASNKYLLSAAIPYAFDKIQITMGGVASALQQLRIYDVQRVSTAGGACSILSLKDKKITPLKTRAITASSVSVQNPVSGNIALHFSGGNKGIYKAELRTADGQFISSSMLNINSQPQTEIIVRPSGLTPGLYFLFLYNQQMQTVMSFKIFIK